MIGCDFTVGSAQRDAALQGPFPGLISAHLPVPATCGDWDESPCPIFSGGFDGKQDRLDATWKSLRLSPGGFRGGVLDDLARVLVSIELVLPRATRSGHAARLGEHIYA